MCNQAYCGINCSSCQLYKATVNNDILMKEKLAVEWGNLYKRSFSVNEMECHGCKSGKKFFLSNACDITLCNINQEKKHAVVVLAFLVNE